MSAEEEIAVVAKNLTDEEKRLLIQFARLLEAQKTGRCSPPDRQFWKNWASSFSADDSREMSEAVEDCERIDENGWS